MHGRGDDIQFIDLGLFGAFSSIISRGEAEANYLGKPLKTSVNKLDIVSLPCVNIYIMPGLSWKGLVENFVLLET